VLRLKSLASFLSNTPVNGQRGVSPLAAEPMARSTQKFPEKVGQLCNGPPGVR
jgi:hypothetical protein